MNILALCCALNNSYLAIEYNNKTISKVIKSDENYHSLYVLSEIKNIIKRENIDLKNLDALCVNCGPGSFTGIRVALSIIKTMAGELNLPIIPLDTAKILLEEYNRNYLIMDARRDMYFIGTKDNIELKLKDEIIEKYKNEEVVTDKNSFPNFSNAINFEEFDNNLALIMLKLAKEKYENSKDKEEFNYLKIEANYIQTPPVF